MKKLMFVMVGVAATILLSGCGVTTSTYYPTSSTISVGVGYPSYYVGTVGYPNYYWSTGYYPRYRYYRYHTYYYGTPYYSGYRYYRYYR